MISSARIRSILYSRIAEVRLGNSGLCPLAFGQVSKTNDILIERRGLLASPPVEFIVPSIESRMIGNIEGLNFARLATESFAYAVVLLERIVFRLKRHLRGGLIV